MIFRYLVFILLSLTLNSAHAAEKNDSDIKKSNGVDIYVDGKHILSYTERKAASLNKMSKLPKEANWNDVVIFAGRKRVLYSDWQERSSGSILTLQPVNGGYEINAALPHKTVIVPQVKHITILTVDHVKKIEDSSTQDAPTLNIRYGPINISISESDLDAIEQIEPDKQGWRLDQILEFAAKISDADKIALSCHSQEKDITLSRKQAQKTFVKLNKNKQWRAIVMDNESTNKKDLIRCKGLETISVEPRT